MFTYDRAFSSYSVNDLAKASEFYRKILGLEVVETPEGLSIRVNPGYEVFVYPKQEHHTPAGFTVLNFEVGDIETAVDGLTAAGVKFLQYGGDLQTDAKGIFRGNGPTIAWFTDPAGNILSVVQGK
jgi:catechol 2,3-dioxygenase-like lactoylglutathione lyase family enzyme